MKVADVMNCYPNNHNIHKELNASDNFYKLVKYCEGLHDGDLTKIGLQPKMDPLSIWTQGYGHAIFINGKALKGKENEKLAFDNYTLKDEAEALKLLQSDTTTREIQLNSLKLVLNQNQFDALLDFVFNFNITYLKESILFKKCITNPHDISIYDEFLRWNKGLINGVLTPLPGLTKRRKLEAELYFTGKLNLT